MTDRNLDVALTVKTHLEKAIQDLNRLEKKTGGAGRAADRSAARMRGLATAIGAATRGASLLSRHMRYLGGALTAISPAIVFRDIISNTVRQERAIAQVEARIRATGGAAGLASEDLQRMAASLQDVTAFGDEAVLEMQALLLSFRGLDGAQFQRISETALDLAAALNQGPREAAIQLGKALEDPAQGLTALRRSGTIFAEAQTKVIKSLAETGRLAEAQRLILDELDNQYGGAARAARQTLGGALNSLAHAWGDLLEVQEGTDDLRESLESLITTLKDPEATRSIQTLSSHVISMIDWMVRNKEVVLAVMGALTGATVGALFGPKGAAVGLLLGTLGGRFAIDFDTESAEEKIATLKKEVDQLDRRRRVVERTGTDREKDGLPALEDEIATRIAMIEVLRRQVALQAAAAERPDLAQPAPAPTSQGVSTAPPSPNRSSDGDDGDALQRSLERARREMAALRRDAARIMDDVGDELATPYDRAVRQAERWGEENRRILLAAGASAEELGAVNEIVQQRIAAAAREAAEEQARAAEDALRSATDWRSGLERGLADLARESEDYATLAEQAVTGAFRGMETALAQFVATGKLGFNDLVQSIISDLARLAVRRSITGPLLSAITAAFGGRYPAGAGAELDIGAGVAHAGGIAGALRTRRSVPAAAFRGAPRLHGGGVLGLAPDEVPAILRRREGVFTPEQMRALGPAQPPAVVVQIVNRGTPQQQVGEARQTVEPDRIVTTLILDDLSRHGPISQGLEHRYALGGRLG